jgi:hypothetical protein
MSEKKKWSHFFAQVAVCLRRVSREEIAGLRNFFVPLGVPQASKWRKAQ